MRKRLIIISFIFGASFISLIALSIFSLERLKSYAYYSDQMDHTNLIISNLYRTQLYLTYIDRAERGYMLKNDTVYLRRIGNFIDSSKLFLNQVDSLVADSTQLQQDVTSLRKEVEGRIVAVNNNLRYIDSTKSTELSQYFENGRNETRECNKLLRKMDGSVTALLHERYKAEIEYKGLTTDTIRTLLIVFCFITLLLFILMVKELSVRIKTQGQLQAKLLDLKRSRGEIEEIAFVTSHDLQEPLRKIQVFSNMLIVQQNGKIEPETKATLERINSAARSMQMMISALMNLSSLTRIEETKKQVDLKVLINNIVDDFKDAISDKKAIIDILNLNSIDGYENQLKVLFTALIDNSLRFTREGMQPNITISGRIADSSDLNELNGSDESKKYYLVSITDNGIGFDNQYINKIFRIFQKLNAEHTDYEGKGIGLAICQRIMANHEGFIAGKGLPMSGANFYLYFPMEV